MRNESWISLDEIAEHLGISRDFFEQRRQLMAQKIKTWFEAL